MIYCSLLRGDVLFQFWLPQHACLRLTIVISSSRINVTLGLDCLCWLVECICHFRFTVSRSKISFAWPERLWQRLTCCYLRMFFFFGWWKSRNQSYFWRFFDLVLVLCMRSDISIPHSSRLIVSHFSANSHECFFDWLNVSVFQVQD